MLFEIELAYWISSFFTFFWYSQHWRTFEYGF